MTICQRCYRKVDVLHPWRVTLDVDGKRHQWSMGVCTFCIEELVHEMEQQFA